MTANEKGEIIMPFIQHVYAREVLDSRGNPTVEVEVLTESGFSAVRLYHLVHQLVNMKQLSFVTETRIVI